MPAKKKSALHVQRKMTITSDFDNNQKKENEELQLAKQTLMKKFLHEIYKQLVDKRISRTRLASLLGISPSYLSQLFYSKKPLTFEILVKCQQILQIDFEITVTKGG